VTRAYRARIGWCRESKAAYKNHKKAENGERVISVGEDEIEVNISAIPSLIEAVRT
jgi:hypothetical protein